MGEILLSLETKGLLCVMISGWSGAGRGEMVYGNENEALWDVGERERDRQTNMWSGREKGRLRRRQFSLAAWAELWFCTPSGHSERSQTACRACQDLSPQLGALADKV